MKRKTYAALLGAVMALSVLGSALPVYAEADTEAQSLDDKEEELVIGSTRDIAPGEQEAYYCIMSLSVWEPLISADNDGNIQPVSYTHLDFEKLWIFTAAARKGIRPVCDAFSACRGSDGGRRGGSGEKGDRGREFLSLSCVPRCKLQAGGAAQICGWACVGMI